jgi:hypothetical protein
MAATNDIDSDSNDSSDCDDRDDVEDRLMLIEGALIAKKARIKKSRYSTSRKRYRKYSNQQFDDDLKEGDVAFLNDDEFLKKYRMSRKSFELLISMIQNHPVFQSKSRGRKQEPVAHQLMVLLKYLGMEGDGSSNHNLRNIFKKGCGSAEAHKNRCIAAIRSLREKFYYWPDADERIEIASRIQHEYTFRHCVGFADGTLNGLHWRPESHDAPDYSGRKFGYSLSTLVVCDDRRKIRYYLAGWPGSAHDNRVFRNSLLYQESDKYFSRKQYLLGDSAYQSTSFIVSAYKKPPNGDMDDLDAMLNGALAKPRVISEHCIGIWKGRFPCLKSIREVGNSVDTSS